MTWAVSSKSKRRSRRLRQLRGGHRNAGLIQDYNYLTIGFDKYLLDKLEIQGSDLEKRVLQGGTDEEIADWVKANIARPLQMKKRHNGMRWC